jgi:hypothetical protein
MWRIFFSTKQRVSGRSFCNKRSIFTNVMIHKEVEDALLSHKPIVALESTIISHGMPYPRNLEVALELENIIRQKGAVPATIAILGGFPKVGLLQSELEFLAKPVEGNNKIIKASRRDIAYACANRLHAGLISSFNVSVFLSSFLFALSLYFLSHHSFCNNDPCREMWYPCLCHRGDWWCPSWC